MRYDVAPSTGSHSRPTLRLAAAAVSTRSALIGPPPPLPLVPLLPPPVASPLLPPLGLEPEAPAVLFPPPPPVAELPEPPLPWPAALPGLTPGLVESLPQASGIVAIASAMSVGTAVRM